MPPWFADPRYGKFSNDPSLTPQQIELISDWVERGRTCWLSEGCASAEAVWTKGWNIPAAGQDCADAGAGRRFPRTAMWNTPTKSCPPDSPKTSGYSSPKIRPSSAQYVHHAVVYVRPPNSTWLRPAPVGVPFTASSFSDPKLRAEAHETTTDMLLVYAPGSEPDRWPDGMAKFIPAGSDLVFQMHYTTNGTAGTDQTSVGMVFAKQPPKQRVLTLQLTNHTFIIPPRTDDYRVDVWGTLPNDCTLLSFFPHMHLRGQALRVQHSSSRRHGRDAAAREPLSLSLAAELSAGRAALPEGRNASCRRSAGSTTPRTTRTIPIPNVEVRWGGQTYEEMMVGFFDVAVPANVDKEQFFVRHDIGRHRARFAESAN